MFKLFFRSITLTTGSIRFGVAVPAMVRMLTEADGTIAPIDIDPNEASSGTVTIELPISLKRKGNETRLVVGSNLALVQVDQSVVDLIAKAHLLFEKLTERPDTSVAEIAKNFGVDRTDVGRILPLAFLAPMIVEGMLQRKTTAKPIASQSSAHASATALVGSDGRCSVRVASVPSYYLG